MADLSIRDVPDKLHAVLKQRARSSGRSLSDEAKALLDRAVRLVGQAEEEAAGKRTLFDVAREHFEGAWLTDEEHADFMKAVEEMRREEGRPLQQTCL